MILLNRSAFSLALTLGCILMIGASRASAADCASLKGQWKNQLGSTLDIQSVDTTTGKIDGRYMTATGAGGWFPLIGWTNEAAAGSGHHVEKVVSFSVRWGGIGSVTAWNGYCEVKSGTPTITTLWHLVRPNSDFEWDHVLTNSDAFTPK